MWELNYLLDCERDQMAENCQNAHLTAKAKEDTELGELRKTLVINYYYKAF